MADIESNINLNIDTSDALAALRSLQRQISTFQQTMSKTGAVSSAQLSNMQQNLVNNINSTGQFTASIQRVATTTESFTTALERNKLSMGQYFRFAGSQVTGFRKLFSTEFDTIDKVARERVKTLQTQYIKLGRDASGAMQAIAVRPQVLDMKDLGTQTAMTAQKAQLFNQLMKQGSTELLNFGKNTQWAGRQLMVGFTIPLGIMGAAAAKEFKAIEEQVIRLERVYGDFTTTMADTEAVTDSVKTLADEFTKYGVAVSKTIGLAADAAAMGKTGADLVAQVAEANRLAVLGGVDQAQSLETTISLTNAFGVASDKLAGKINFLNAVENQTVTSIEDMTDAIPKAGPVVQQLGGNVEDLTFFLTAMKEGGINASEGANALKSGLASLINPTGEANEMLAGFGINLQGIVEANKGNVRGIVVDFAKALDTLDPLNRAQAIEQLFGKFQFSRLSTLFQNVIAEGSQAQRVLQLTSSSAAELSALSERELSRIEESPLYKFEGAVERFKAALAPIGETFMKAVTPIIDFGTQLLESFNGWSDQAKNFTVILTGVVAGLGPILLMTFGLIANGVANVVKGFMFVRGMLDGTGRTTNVLAEQTNYMTTQQLEAAAVASSLGQVHNSLIQTFNAEAGSIRNLAGAYGQAIGAQSAFMGPITTRGGGMKRFAKGGIINGPGTGTSDSIVAMVSDGEAVIPAKSVKKNPGLIAALVSGNIPKFSSGTTGISVAGRAGRNNQTQSSSAVASHYDILSPGQLAGTIAEISDELGDFQVKLFQISESATEGAIDVEKLDVRLADLGDTSQNVVASGQTFSGTTQVSRGSRNAMFVAAGIEGEAFTLDGLIEQGELLEQKMADGTLSYEKHKEEIDILTKQASDAKAALEASSDATKARTDYMRSSAKTIMTDALISKEGMDATSAAAEAERRLAIADRELERSRQAGATVEDQITAAKKKYVALALKTNDTYVASPTEMGTENPRQMAAGRGTPSKGRFRRIGTRTGFAEGEMLNPKKGLSAVVVAEANAVGQGAGSSLARGLVDGAAIALKKAFKINSPSKEMNDIGEDIKDGLDEGLQKAIPKARKTGEQIGDGIAEGAKAGARKSRRVSSPGTADIPMVTQSSIHDETKRRPTERVSTGMLVYDKVSGQYMEKSDRDKLRAERKAEAIERAKNVRKLSKAERRQENVQNLKNAASPGRIAGAGMMASMAVGGLSMVGGPVGNVASAVSGPLMAITGVASVLSMIPGPAGLVVAGLSAIAVAGFMLKDTFDKAQRSAEAFAHATTGSTEAISAITEAAGTVSASEQMDKRRENAKKIAPATEEQNALSQSYLQSDFGKTMLESLGKNIVSNGTEQSASNIANQMATAISQGAISKIDADQVINEIGKQLGDSTFSLKAIGKLDKLVGTSGEDLAKDPVGIRLEILDESKKSLEQSINSLQNVSLDQTNTQNALKIGAMWGPVGLQIGQAVGGIMDMFNYFEDIGTQTGAFAANMVVASQQSQQMLDSLQLEYEQRIEIAKAAGDTAKAESLAKEYAAGRSAILAKNAEMYKAGEEAFSKSGNKTEIIGSVDQQIKDRYKEGPQKAIAEQSIAAIGEAAGGTTAELTLKTVVASGDVDPQTMNTLLGMFKTGKGNVDILANLVTNFGSADADRIMEFATLAKTPNLGIRFTSEMEDKTPEQTTEILDTLDIIGKYGGQAALTVAVSGKTENVEQLKDTLDQVDAYFVDGFVKEASVVFNTFGIPQTKEAMDYFNSLSPSEQKTYTAAYLTVFKSIDANTAAGKAELIEWAKTQGGGLSKYSKKGGYLGLGGGVDFAAIGQAQASAAAQAAIEQSRAAMANFSPNTSPTTTPSGGGGGGGGSTQPEKAPTSFLDSIVKDLRDFTNTAQGLTENFQDSMNAIRSATGSVFGGLSQQLRGLGAGEDVVSLMTGMSKEDWDQYKNQFFNFDAAGNITSFKSDLNIISEKLKTITLGKFVDQQQKSIAASRDQAAALSKLAGLGMSYADAYKVVEDAAVAAAIANAKSAEDIRKIIALAQEAQRAQTLAGASSNLANANKATDATVAGLNALVRFNSALSDTQISAILANEDLQVMLANFDTLTNDQLKILDEALADIAAKEDLQIKIKMQTPEGMQEIFDEGFNKAMEQFSAKEQSIKIKFEALRNPFEDIVNSFTDQIEDIRNAPGGIDDLEADLERIAEQEVEINKKYEDRFKALDTIQKANERIAAQQRGQLSLAEALSMGDIAAAARAAQEIRAADAAQAIVDQREALQKSQELELAALTGQMGLTREQIETRIRDLKREIFNLEESQIEPAQRQLELLQRQEESELKSVTVLGQTKDQWEAIKNATDLARVTSAGYESDMKKTLGVADQLIAKWADITKPKTTIHTIIEEKIASNDAAAAARAAQQAAAAQPAPQPQPVAQPKFTEHTIVRGDTLWAIASRYLGAGNRYMEIFNNSNFRSGNPNLIYPGEVARIPLATGGMVPGYFARGTTKPVFGPKGTDTVPAMLTPGEFVVKKWAVDNFGAENLQAINNGKYRGGSVYNNMYSITVNARTNANSDEIAKTVIAQIKQIDAQRIRGNRF